MAQCLLKTRAKNRINKRKIQWARMYLHLTRVLFCFLFLSIYSALVRFDGCFNGNLFVSVWNWAAREFANVVRGEIWIHSVFCQREHYSPESTCANTNQTIYSVEKFEFECVTAISGRFSTPINFQPQWKRMNFIKMTRNYCFCFVGSWMSFVAVYFLFSRNHI